MDLDLDDNDLRRLEVYAGELCVNHLTIKDLINMHPWLLDEKKKQLYQLMTRGNPIDIR